MGYSIMHMQEFEARTSRGELAFDAVSPSGAAKRLGISRQAVHKAIRANRLDAYWLTDNDGTHLATLIPVDQLLHYRDE